MSALLLMGLLLSAPTVEPVDPVQAATLAGDAERMVEQAELRLKAAPQDAQAHAVLGMGRWIIWSRAAWIWGDRWAKQQARPRNRAGQQLLRGLMREVPEANRFVEVAFRNTLESFAVDLKGIHEHLQAADQPSFALLVQPAAFAFDVDMSGQLEPGERGLFEVERDAAGALFPANDPRRRPTFRLDQGDVKWALAYVSFQRALVEVALAYDIMGSRFWLNPGSQIDIKLKDPARVKGAALTHIKAGLAYSKAAREAYLAETDDDREWLPNPTQRNQGLPLPVDAALYETWAQALMEIGALLDGAAALDLDEICGLLSAQLGGDPESAAFLKPSGHGQRINVQALLSDPGDIQIQLSRASEAEGLGIFLEQVFPGALTKTLPRSGLPALIFKAATKAQGQREKGVEGVKNMMLFKARYLVWIN